MNTIRKWLHKRLGWGFPAKGWRGQLVLVGGDSFQPTYLCRFCDKELAQDSTGAYFHLSSKAGEPDESKRT